MGGGSSAEQEQRERESLDNFLKNLPAGPDLGVVNVLMKFTSLSSTENLKIYYETRKTEAGNQAASWIKQLAEKLARFSPSPNVAGLGALGIAMFIDVLSYSPPENSIKNALRSVFAEEKVTEVWDLIDECLKRVEVNLVNTEKLSEDIERIESQLSEALTKLKNSMLRDGNMANQAIKVWVNGAAFHIQMIIHLVRLQGGNPTDDSIERLLSVYQRDVDQIFDKHEDMIIGKCSMFALPPFTVAAAMSVGSKEYFVTEESKYYYVSIPFDIKQYSKAYYDHRYGTQKRNIQQYLRGVGQDVPELVRQKGSLNIN